MSTLANYLDLTKPRILPMVLLSGLPAIILASDGWPSLTVTAAILVGMSFVAGAANSLNAYIERDLDALMERTRNRPIPSGRLQPERALAFGLLVGGLGIGILYWASGLFPALIALSAILLYVFIYTLWLKPRTPVAVIVGGVSGAIAPLLADAALGGDIGPVGCLLFAIVFIWQPPHFYAISLYRRDDYKAAGFPMIHDRIGEDATYRRIIIWILGLIPVTLLPVAFSLLGGIYASAAIGLGALFLFEARRLSRERTEQAAKRTLRVSLLYLLGIFVSMLVDLAAAALTA
jgi:protoheme IX farnesyltransferase